MNRLNIDYEKFLFDSSYKSNGKINSCFESLLFFIFDSPENRLIEFKHNSDFLDYLKSLEIDINIIKTSKSIINFWGKLENIELERKINSKVTSSEIFKQSNIDFPIYIGTIRELNKNIDFIKHKKWLLRPEGSFSGIGNVLITCDSKYKASGDTNYILTPYFERILDLGITINLDNYTDLYFVENRIDSLGKFKGACLVSNIDLTQKFTSYGLDLKRELESIYQYCDLYKKMGARGSIQIDTFIYKDDQCFKYFNLVEVNYRKTMGTVLKLLSEKYCFSSDISELCLISVRKGHDKSMYNQEFIYRQSKQEGVIPLVDCSRRPFLCLIIGKNKEIIAKYLKKLESYLIK